MEFLRFFQTSPVPPDQIARALWLIIAFPLGGAVVCGVLGKWLGRANTGLIASATVFGSFLLSLLAHWAVNDVNTQFMPPHALEALPYTLGWDHGVWFAAGSFQVHFGFWVDHLTSTMLLVVTGVGFLIHVYSTGYMSHDPGYWRYFAYLNLFVAAMLTLVLADNLVLLFVGWEGVGLCSYLLIGFWYTDPAKAWAGRKAFVTNRIGDFAFVIGMCLTVLLAQAYVRQGTEANMGPGMRRERFVAGVAQVGALNLQGVEAMARGIALRAGPGTAINQDSLVLDGPLKGWTFGGTVTAILLLFLLGAAGKSAQIPLYVWLPDAMAGPTPVSALIHAATMVTAGVYLFCRVSALLVLSPTAMVTVAIVGTATALLAAVIAFAQDDIKKVLAYSTVSQLGIMFMAVGFGMFWAAIFHLVTHAFFKACLFLGAGSVMHGNADETDIKRLGGLRHEMKLTHATFLIAWLAITGILPLSGYFSKDAILHGIHGTHLSGYGWATNVVWILGLVVAGCTSFYMTRLYFLTFWGKRSGEAKVPHAHESGWSMTLPLILLAGGAVVLLLLGLPLMQNGQIVLENFLSPVFRSAARIRGGIHSFEVHAEAGLPWGAYLTASAIAIGAGALAWYLYARYFPGWRAAGKPAPAAAAMARAWAVAKFKVDELYDLIVIRPVKFLAFVLYRIVDALLIDTLAVRGVAWVTYRVGAALRYLQTGDAQGYAAVMAAALAAGVAWVLFAP